jgi:voltage-dependent calcium channel
LHLRCPTGGSCHAGVVVENFSYVFQTTGGAKAVTREEMRAFKKTWLEFANPKTEFLEREQFVPFFRVSNLVCVHPPFLAIIDVHSLAKKLGGIFEVRIYPAEFSIHNILASCTDTTDPDNEWRSATKSPYDVNLKQLDATLSRIDYEAIRRRRQLFSRLYHEAVLTHQRGKGISFTDMLLLLAHHKLIVDSEALV